MPPASETPLIMSAERTGFYSLGVEVSDCTPRKISNEKQCENQSFCNDTATVQPYRNYFKRISPSLNQRDLVNDNRSK